MSLIQTLRGPKIFGMAIFDWTLSILGLVLLGITLKIKTAPKWIAFVFAWILFGVAVHKLMGVDTMLGYYLGLNPKPTRK